MLGWLNREDIFKIYSRSHILICFQTEGFPKVVAILQCLDAFQLFQILMGYLNLLNMEIMGLL